MAQEMSDFLKDSILDHILKNTAYGQPVGLHLALSKVTLNSADTGATLDDGTHKPTWTGYGRLAITFDAASGGVAVNSAGNIDFVNGVGGPDELVVAAALCDASSGGNMLYFDNGMADTTVVEGATLRFEQAGVTIKQDTP